MDAVAAKEFLISRVVQEAELTHMTLSETERKMLYFTEAHPSLSDILEVNAQFEREYDADQYEHKIANLLKSARARDRQAFSGREDEWRDALEALKKEDHYILVMVDIAFANTSAAGREHRFRDFLIYIAVGIGVVLALLWWSLKH